jgi:hypothetical protein
VVHGGTDSSETPHKTLLDIARQHPVLANVDHQFVAGHFLLASTRMSILVLRIRHRVVILRMKIFLVVNVEKSSVAPTTG